MESLKKAETVLTVTNTAGLLAGFLYFYRSQSHMQGQIEAISSTLKVLAKTVEGLQTENIKCEHLTKMVQRLNNEVENLNSQISNAPTPNEFMEVMEQIQLVTKAVKDSGIDFPDEYSYSEVMSGQSLGGNRNNNKTKPMNRFGNTVSGMNVSGSNTGESSRQRMRHPPATRSHNTQRRNRHIRFNDDVDNDNSDESDIDDMVNQVRMEREK